MNINTKSTGNKAEIVIISEFIKNESGDSKDTTVSDKNIPYAGEAIRIIIGIFIGAIILGIILKRCIDLKDIK